jgi:BMFP domain-containing protein YqiC
MESNSTYSDLKSSLRKYDDSFLMGRDKLGFAMDAFKEKWDLGQVSGEDKKKLAEYTSFKRDSISSLNNYIKQITGAAMSEQEAKRLMKGMPNPGIGMFDGDSPTEFKAKMDAILASLDRVTARDNYILKNGLKSFSAVSLDSMDGIIDKRGEEIESALKKQYPDKKQAELNTLVAHELSEEFGIRF